MPNDICRVPVTAVYTVHKGSDKPILTSAEYADIPADAIARFLIEHCGADAIFGEEAKHIGAQRNCILLFCTSLDGIE